MLGQSNDGLRVRTKDGRVADLGVRIGYDADEQAVVVLAIPEHISKAFSKGGRSFSA
jgi:hypothetical protein